MAVKNLMTSGQVKWASTTLVGSIPTGRLSVDRLNRVRSSGEFRRLLAQFWATIAPTLVIDRNKRPHYPKWVAKVLYPEYECSGPEELDPQKIGLHFHPDQKRGAIGSIDLHCHIRDSGMINSCLNLQDGEAMVTNPELIPPRWIGDYGYVPTGQKNKHVWVVLWKSVVETFEGDLRVPTVHLSQKNDRQLEWIKIGFQWGITGPAAFLPDSD